MSREKALTVEVGLRWSSLGNPPSRTFSGLTERLSGPRHYGGRQRRWALPSSRIPDLLALCEHTRQPVVVVEVDP